MTGLVLEGLAVAVDYGHVRADRVAGAWDGGTLAAYRRGRLVSAVPDGRATSPRTSRWTPARRRLAHGVRDLDPSPGPTTSGGWSRRWEHDPVTTTQELLIGVGVGAHLECDATLPLRDFHPSAHAGFQLQVRVEDGVVQRTDIRMGLMHRGSEKLFESRDYRQIDDAGEPPRLALRLLLRARHRPGDRSGHGDHAARAGDVDPHAARRGEPRCRCSRLPRRGASGARGPRAGARLAGATRRRPGAGHRRARPSDVHEDRRHRRAPGSGGARATTPRSSPTFAPAFPAWPTRCCSSPTGCAAWPRFAARRPSGSAPAAQWPGPVAWTSICGATTPTWRTPSWASCSRCPSAPRATPPPATRCCWSRCRRAWT